MGQFGQEPEPSQVTGMSLVRCILGKFLGVVCHCFPPSSECCAACSRTLHSTQYTHHMLPQHCKTYNDVSLSGSSTLCMITISNIKRYRVGESKHNTLLRCKVSQGRRHVSALYYKAIIRSDMVKTKEENYNVTL